MEKERMRILKNGIRLYSYRNPALHSFYISLFLRAGSMYESDAESGITHFLEHVAIRNVNAAMNGGLYPLLDKYGIEFNAATYSEMVQFYVSGASGNFAVGAEILSYLMKPITLSVSEISTERDRIKAEIRENDDRSSLAAFTAGIVHEGTTLARPITGTVASVSRISRSRLEAYRRRVFTRENLFIYVTGAFEERDLDALAEFFEGYELSEGEPHGNVAPVSRDFFRRDGRVQLKNGDYTMVRFSFDMDMSRISVEESDLLYDILLGGYNSRFFIELSERRGIFYDLSGATERYKNIGTLSFYYEVRPDAVTEAVALTLGLLAEIRETPLSEAECMKAGYVDNAYMLYDDPRELNFTFAYDNHVLDAGYRSLDERISCYKQVTPERLSEVFRRVFRRENLTITVKGNKKRIDTEALERLVQEF